MKKNLQNTLQPCSSGCKVPVAMGLVSESSLQDAKSTSPTLPWWRQLPRLDHEQAAALLAANNREDLMLGTVRLIRHVAYKFVGSKVFPPSSEKLERQRCAQTLEDMLSVGLTKAWMLIYRVKEAQDKDGNVKLRFDGSIDNADNIPAFLARSAKNEMITSDAEDMAVRIPRPTQNEYRKRGQFVPQMDNRSLLELEEDGAFTTNDESNVAILKDEITFACQDDIDREIVRMREEERDDDEIAAALGIGKRTVCKRLNAIYARVCKGLGVDCKSRRRGKRVDPPHNTNNPHIPTCDAHSPEILANADTLRCQQIVNLSSLLAESTL